jgi:hypothetical protein
LASDQSSSFSSKTEDSASIRLVNVVGNSLNSPNDYNSNPSNTLTMLVNVLNVLNEEDNIDTDEALSFEMFLHVVLQLAQRN